MTIAEIRKKAVPILRNQGVLKAAIFGSVARGDNKKKSDIDFLIEMKKNASLFDLGGLQMDLQKKLGKKVDLVEYCCIHPMLKRQILKEKIKIYEKKRN